MDKKKRLYLIIGGVALLLVIVITVVWASVFALPEPEPEEPVREEEQERIEPVEEEEEEIHSYIDNTVIEKEEERMIAVIIENHTESRRQMAGLEEASLVFEAEAEGGITRFLAFYPYQDTERVGPVRSARPYFVRWAEQFDSALAHAGGSELGLSTIYSSGHVFDLDGLALEGGLKYFTRDYVYFAPHNLFTNIDELRELMNDRGWDKPLEDPYFEFGDLSDDSADNAETVHIYYPFPEYFVRYEYDEDTGVYERFQDGDPHIDHGSEKQITASNVVVLITNYYPTDEVGRLYMKTEGSGDMYLFRDGKVIPGTWKRPETHSPYTFYDENGEELVFASGKTWVSVVNYQSGLQWE
ncbi:DUF3048 domain-containing protein [Candidatus Peregrinibacteria bacterium]|nr:DUF3048 domain-containing protein [Candidatus Peregrinibacteria bacterium]